MGDISELRGLIFTVSFLGVLVLLISWFPAELYVAGDMRTVETPEALFETIDVYSFAETKTIRFNETGGNHWWVDPTFYRISIDIGEWEAPLYYKIANESGLSCRLQHIHYEWFIPRFHDLEWADQNGAVQSDDYGHLTVGDIQTNAELLNNGSSVWRAWCSHFTYHVTFGFNNTVYNNFTHAWNNQDLYAFFGVNFDDLNTSYNAFQLIAMLMFFQLPETNPYINAIISIPLWVSIVYLIYVLIIKVIPFIAGG